jgi:nucleoside-diphosphate-sugar epimerase
VLEAISRLPNPERLIIFSTSEVYGPYVYKATEDGLTTQGAVGKMRWVYATSKLAAEHLASCYAQEYNIPLTIIRPFNVYGPRQVGESAITKFTIAALKNDTLFIAGDGSQIRSWCYIDDFIDGVMAALESPVAIGEVFNLGNPKQTCIILNLAETILRLTNSTSEIRFFEQDAPDVEVRVPSTAKAQRLLGYAPRYGLEDGLKKTIRWYKKMGDR